MISDAHTGTAGLATHDIAFATHSGLTQILAWTSQLENPLVRVSRRVDPKNHGQNRPFQSNLGRQKRINIPTENVTVPILSFRAMFRRTLKELTIGHCCSPNSKPKMVSEPSID